MQDYTINQLISALKRADAAGDTEAATAIAKKIKLMQTNQTQPITEQPTIQQPATGMNTVETQTIEQPQPDQNSVTNIFNKNLNAIKTGADILATVGSSAVAEPVAGIAGIAATTGSKLYQKFFDVTGLDPFDLTKSLNIDKKDASEIGTDVIKLVREKLTLNPNADTAEILVDVANSPIIKKITKLSESGTNAAGDYLAEIGEEIGGKEGRAIGGALGKTLATGAEMVVGGVVGKAAEKVIKIAKIPVRAVKSDLPADKLDLIKTAEQNNLKLQTSDLLDETESVIAQNLQTLNERIPLVGTGKARVNQQKARVEILEKIKNDFNIDNGSNFEIDIVKNIKEESLRKLTQARTKRTEAIDSLNQFGKVPTLNVKKEISEIVKKAQKVGVGTVVDKDTIVFLQDINKSISGKNFGELAQVRTRLINKIETVKRSEDKGGISELQKAKTAIDRQMKVFAKKNDINALKKWKDQNAEFTDELQVIKNTAIKGIIEKGDFDERKIMPLLRSGSQKELNTLKRSLDKKGIKLVQSSIIKDIFDKTGGVDNLNPDRFITKIKKLETDRALNTFLNTSDKKQLDGLVKVLDATRRAQKATSEVRTGDVILSLTGVGTGAASVATGSLAPILGVAGTVKAFNSIYNSKPVRNYLIKLSAVKKGSKQESDLLTQAGIIFSQAKPIENNENKENN
jgi:hypothetical protein